MTKYIRTTSGIYKSEEYWKKPPIEIMSEDQISRADTIEELCDEFVFKSKDGWFNKPYHQIQSEYKEFRKCWLFYKHSENDSWFGAIWTDKGLIYVAKMNDKGELELI